MGVGSYLVALWTYQVYFVPTFVGFLFAAPAMLRVWLAVERLGSSHLPPTNESDAGLGAPPAPPNGLKIIAWLLAGATGLAIGIGAYLLRRHQITSSNAGVFLFAAFLCIASFVGWTVVLISHIVVEVRKSPVLVHRGRKGAIVTTEAQLLKFFQSPASDRSSLFITLLCVLFVCGAIISSNRLITEVLMIAVISGVNQLPMKTISFRKIFGFSGLFSMFGAFITTYIVYVVYISQDKWSTPTSGESTSEEDFVPIIAELIGWNLIVIGSGLQGQIITLSYRFDYYLWTLTREQTGEADPIADSEATVELIAAATMGIRAPSKAQIPPFPKRYFTIALVTWLATHVVGLAGMPILHPAFQCFGVIALGCISMPLVSLALASAARLKGQSEEIWAYKEGWSSGGNLPGASSGYVALTA
ncbi:hypothetical protein SISNIDRAFT_553050 [Sistotremastrum niveocremeum HHB9708]|uniref:Uncharacterized protein n=2 Tax=Sistotremastraceae TaxID=3402574 RepID=A0A164NHV8_9AGAM|nr:hypothetical protein SISNIDRAFT_553050 [Sistotremastrum niveocremeum HHB9708]KZT35351.1 hypothetical protein SISSUDRAFT_1131176 [Sistotremastrum suecicum HHB10207 ss-3]